MVNSCFVLICVYPPSSYSYTLFNFGYQKTPPQKKYDPAFTVSKDINWRQLTSNYIFFSKCNKRKRKIKGKNSNIEREREQERERERARGRERGIERKNCSLIRVQSAAWFFWERFGLWTGQLLLEKTYLSSLGSRISSGKVGCNSKPWEQTYLSELDPLMAQCLANLWKKGSLIRV